MAIRLMLFVLVLAASAPQVAFSQLVLGSTEPDTDGDGVADSTDNSPLVFNDSDSDGDGLGDAVDPFVAVPDSDVDSDALLDSPGGDPDPFNPNGSSARSLLIPGGPVTITEGDSLFLSFEISPVTNVGGTQGDGYRHFLLQLDVGNNSTTDGWWVEDIAQGDVVGNVGSGQVVLTPAELLSLGFGLGANPLRLDLFGPFALATDSVTTTITINPVPEPSTLFLLAIASLGGFACWRKRRNVV